MSTTQRVRDALALAKAGQEWMTPHALADQLDVDVEAVRKVVNRLMKTGQAERRVGDNDRYEYRYAALELPDIDGPSPSSKGQLEKVNTTALLERHGITTAEAIADLTSDWGGQTVQFLARKFPALLTRVVLAATEVAEITEAAAAAASNPETLRHLIYAQRELRLAQAALQPPRTDET